MSRILVAEDEMHIARGLRFNLEAEGHAVELIGSGEEALERLLGKREQFDLLVLDVMLPGKNGFAVASELRRARHYIPLLMLTARGRPEDVLQGFESGADDYLPKPFNLDILIARIASLLRRRDWMNQPSPGTPVPPHAQPAEPQPPELFRFDGKTFDFQTLQLQSHSEMFQLTLMESELLGYLIRNAGRPVSRKEILEKVWDLHEDTDTRAIDNFIVRLRRYIEDEPSRPKHLLTVRGLGYQFVAEPDESK